MPRFVLSLLLLVAACAFLLFGLGRAIDHEIGTQTGCDLVFTDFDAQTLSEPCEPFPNAPAYGAE